MLSDCGLEHNGSTLIWCDNLSVIIVAKNLTGHGRTKHIEIRFHFNQNLIAEGVIVLEHCPTNSQIADILTKPLGSQKFNYQKMLLRVTDFHSRGGVKVD